MNCINKPTLSKGRTPCEEEIKDKPDSNEEEIQASKEETKEEMKIGQAEMKTTVCAIRGK
jgi:hypothetical protein